MDYSSGVIPTTQAVYYSQISYNSKNVQNWIDSMVTVPDNVIKM